MEYNSNINPKTCYHAATQHFLLLDIAVKHFSTAASNKHAVNAAASDHFFKNSYAKGVNVCHIFIPAAYFY